jgi:hypothetical protein
LLLAIAWSWRRVLHNAVSASSYNAPMILKFRNNAWNNRSAGIGNNGGSAMIRQRPNWMLSQPDLRRCGPEYPQHSLRLAMGGMFMPLTVTSRLRQCAFFVLPSLLFVAVMMLLSLQNHHGDGALSLWKAGGFAALVWGGGFGASMLAFACLMQLAMRWRSANAELPLLTLLPGLPAGERGKHALLRAILIPALRWQLALWLVLLCCMIGLHLSKSSVVFLLLTPLGAMGFTIAFVLLIVGGKLPRPWASTALGIFGCVLINVSLFIPALNDTSTMRIGGGSLLELLAAAWIVLGSVLLWLGYRGWNGVVQRRHLFLPS